MVINNELVHVRISKLACVSIISQWVMYLTGRLQANINDTCFGEKPHFAKLVISFF